MSAWARRRGFLNFLMILCACVVAIVGVLGGMQQNPRTLVLNDENMSTMLRNSQCFKSKMRPKVKGCEL